MKQMTNNTMWIGMAAGIVAFTVIFLLESTLGSALVVAAMTCIWMVLHQRQAELLGTRDACSDESETLMSPALNEVHATVLEELGHSLKEVMQAIDIIRDAGLELGHGFEGLNEKTTQQRALMAELIDASGGNGGITHAQFTQRTADLLEHFVGLILQLSSESLRIVYRIDEMSEEMDAV
ncbi:MAG: methyl-accepting chemotaxis protein, partial [Gammaproteobacteria bacterium HGW-Gammaproteobacteria-6]